MKKWIATLLVFVLLTGVAFAAEWPEGRSASQPYAGVPEVDLSQTIGYFLIYPRAKLPAEVFCNVLEFYLPREDIKLGQGTLTLYNGEGEALTVVNFEDAESVGIRPLSESELERLMWGSGVCVYARLPKSLEFNQSYYVLMDEGCFTSEDGSVAILPVVNPEAWTPVVQGDYGVSGLYYSAPVEAPEDSEEGEAAEAAEEAEAPAEAEETEEAPAEIEYKLTPAVGDVITFDLVMGGDAKFAVIYTENDSVMFDEIEYTESGTVVGTVTKDELNWGIVFLTEQGEVVYSLYLGD